MAFLGPSFPRAPAVMTSFRHKGGLRLREGTIVDASLIEAPSSTKNKAGRRDPEMRQTKKGNQWYFGMKAHIGVDARSGVVHSLCTTAACERARASVRAKVEHPFLYLKRRFGYARVRYRGLAKNRQRIALLPGFANSPTSSTPSDRTKPLADIPPPSTFTHLQPMRPPCLICPEPGQNQDTSFP